LYKNKFMLNNYTYTVTERFLEYVTIDTQSDPYSNTHPTTEKQKDLSSLLVKHLLAIGITDAETNEYGYVYTTIPSNTDKEVPTICFCSHVDTTSDCSGAQVKPIVHHNYQGQDIVLPDDNNIVLSAEKYTYLKQHIGHDIITASGTTLLGADDKAGVAIIVDMATYLMQHPQVKHGAIRILFTPDEEVGKGTAKLDMQKLNAQYGYTLDGGAAGDLEDETFSADGVTITINGVSAHPGDAKGKMVNALKIVGELLTALPKDTLSPESTEGKDGFVHPLHIDGIAEKVSLTLIVRDFVTAGLAIKEKLLEDLTQRIVSKYNGASFTMEVTEQYRNMKEVLDTCPQVIAYAKQAIEAVGLTPKMTAIRGGTDGSRLSFMGLPTANIFTGMQNIHSKKEWVGIKDMQLAVQTLVQLVQIWEKNS
jgi:tripeptide aminopeptidase